MHGPAPSAALCHRCPLTWAVPAGGLGETRNVGLRHASLVPCHAARSAPPTCWPLQQRSTWQPWSNASRSMHEHVACLLLIIRAEIVQLVYGICKGRDALHVVSGKDAALLLPRNGGPVLACQQAAAHLGHLHTRQLLQDWTAVVNEHALSGDATRCVCSC